MDVMTRQMMVIPFLFKEVLPTLYNKGREYQTDDGDSNGNFKKVAKEQDMTTHQVWNSHFSKHLDAIRNYCKEPGRVMAEPIEGRIVDAINYLLILYTLKMEMDGKVPAAPDVEVLKKQFVAPATPSMLADRSLETKSVYGGGDGGE